MKKSLEEQTLEHAKTAYTNVQENIRFVDTKAGALTGLATLITGLPVLVLQWITTEQSTENTQWHIANLADCHPIVLPLVSLIFAGGIACGVLSLWLALDCTTARPPSKKGKTTVLFPLAADMSNRFRIIRRLKNGMSDPEIAKEYQTQLLRVGFILAKKSCKLRRAVKWFQVQMALYGAGAIGLTWIYLCQMS